MPQIRRGAPPTGRPLDPTEAARIRRGQRPQSCITPQGRFIAKVEKLPSGCWNWVGYVKTTGYGILGIGKYKQFLAHRLSHEWHKGPIPDGYQVDHLCRNTRCVNPEHLEAVPPRVNFLRSNAVGAIAHRTNRCAKGHDLEGSYVRPDRRGRICRECRRRYYRASHPIQEAA